LLEPIPGARFTVGFGGSSEKYVLVLAGEDAACWRPRRGVEQELRTVRGIGNVTSTSSCSGRNSWCGPISRALPTSASARRHRRHAAHRHRRRLRPGPGKLNLSQRQVPVVVKLPPAARAT